MTFVVGFKCVDGIVICTDSLEADGLTKRPVDKTRLMGTTDWTVAVAGAGSSGLIDKFCDELSSEIGRGSYDQKHFEKTIEEALVKFRYQYQESEDHFRVLVGISSVQVPEFRLYRSDSSHLSPIKDHAHIGMGHSLWRFLSANLYVPGNSVDDNSRLAIFIMREAINHVDGVDGPIRLASYTFGNERWKLSKGPFFPTLQKFEEGVRQYDVKKVMKDSWELCNPPSRSEQRSKFNGVRTPGDELTFLDGVKMEGLGSISGQNRAANSFWCNRDRLRKRAWLQRGMAQS